MTDVDWSRFAGMLAGVVGCDQASIARDSRLTEDLGLDSLCRMEMIVELADAGLASEGTAVESARTAGDLFDAAVPSAMTVAPGTRAGHDGGGRRGPTSDLHAAPVVPPPVVPAAFTAADFAFHVPVAEDIPYLYWLATSEGSGWRWRYRGRVPTPDAFNEGLWTGVLTQFVVRRRRSHERVGQVVVYDADHESGFAFLAAVFNPRLVGSGVPAGVSAAFVRYAFDQWAFRKLYLEVPEFNLPLIASGVGGALREEGRLRRHDFSGGRYWDRHILAIYRDAIPPGTAVAPGTGPDTPEATAEAAREAAF
jgi:RimJ/RimL family protein N-acetyltransferase/acyl carrier protein